MPDIEIRPFRRADREQLATLANAHIGAVVPGWAISVQALLAQLEREPREAIVDPWVAERMTLVAELREQVVAAAHLRRYSDDDRAPEHVSGSAEIAWLIAWPDCAAAGAQLAEAAVGQLDRWGARRQHADGALPTPATYGIPDCWPHVEKLLESLGFHPGGPTEVILVAGVEDLPTSRGVKPPVDGLSLRRAVAHCSTAFVAYADGAPVGTVRVEADQTQGGVLSRLAGWAGMWECSVEEGWQRRGIGRWLLGHSADWLRLGGCSRLIDQAWPEQEDYLAFLGHMGFRELVRTRRGWERSVDGPG